MNAHIPINKMVLNHSLIFFMCLIMLGCKGDRLNLSPVDSLSESSIFDTPDRVKKLLFGLYDSMKDRGYYGSRYMVFSDLRGADFLNESQNTGNGLQVWNHTLESSFREPNEVWGAMYYTINSCNIFIAGLRTLDSSVQDEIPVLQYEAEAKFLRAVSYFSLLSVYARPYADGNGDKLGVVLRLVPQPGGVKDKARSSVAEVYDQILEDLEFAVQHLAMDFGDNYKNTTRAHQNTALAFRTRVYLSMANYTGVIEDGNMLVSNNPPFFSTTGVSLELSGQISQLFIPPYTHPENIFSLPSSSEDPLFLQGALASFYRPPSVGLGDFSLNPRGIIGDSLFEELDARQDFVKIYPQNNKPYLNKFSTGQPYTDYVPVLRYAEVLLNLAEAITRTCNCIDIRAIELLNAVRGRSNPNAIYAEFENFSKLLDAISIERRIEFLGEGLASLDISRLLLPFPAKANVPAITPDNSEYIWPIPVSELSANSLCEPNP